VKPLPLRASLTLRYTAMLALLLSALAVGYHRVLIAQLDAETTAVIADITRGLHGYLQFSGGQPRLAYDRDDPEAVTFIESATRYYQIFDADSGRLLVQSPAMESLGLHYTPEEIRTFRANPHVHDVVTDSGRLRLQSSLITPPAGGTYLLQVGEPLTRVERAIARLERMLWWSLGVGVLFAGLVGHWMAGRALEPLARLARTIRDVDMSNLHARVPVRGAGDELDAVASSFNVALARVEDGVGQMRQFSAALAHELRTPLAILRGETELALARANLPSELRQQMEGQLEEFDRLARLITQILTLARAEAGEIRLAHDPVDLGALVVDIGEQMESVAQARDVRLMTTVDGQAMVRGDRGWLERLLLILLDNAIKFTPPGGRVSATVRVHAGTAALEVADTGVGIDADSLPRVFDRFYQADASRSRSDDRGAGLGLALARWIVAHHQGTIEVASTPGTGAVFTVRLSINES
jgi:heavy metal sensor kinase